MKVTEETVRASVIAHAIKLGKCPPVGCVLSFNLHIDSLDTGSGETKQMTDKKRYRFEVTEQDVAAAQRLLEDERWTHGAKTTVMPLERGMTREEAEQLGYRVIKASDFEVGLVKGDKGVRTWWAQDFDRKLPDLGHHRILRAAQAYEDFLGMMRIHVTPSSSTTQETPSQE